MAYAPSTSYVVEDKFRTLRMRKDEQRRLGAHIDALVRQAENDGDAPRGCGLGICTLFKRWRRGGGAASGTTTSTESRATSDSLAVSRAVFGLAGVKKADPAAKLDEAATVMRARIEQLEARAAEHRAEAAKLAKQPGQKSNAIRALKKAKAIEAQVEANQASVMAVESQVDMLAQASLQKTLSSALASTNKAMKKDAKAMGKAEKAIDEAQEVRDMASDLNAVISDFAGNAAEGLDDDDLMAELDEMAAADEPPPPPVDAQLARAAEIAELEARIAARKAEMEHSADIQSTVAAMPSAPVGGRVAAARAAKREEKTGLLASV